MSNKLFAAVGGWFIFLWILSGLFGLASSGLIIYILYKIATHL